MDTRGNGRALSQRAGLTLIEVVVSAAVVTILVLGVAAAFSTSIGSTEAARRMTRGTLHLETVFENVGALSAGDLLALDGTRVWDNGTEQASDFGVGIAVFEVEPGLLQAELALLDTRTDRTLGTAVTQRTLR